MNFLSSSTINYVEFAALVVAAVFITYKQISTNSSKVSSDTIEAYKAQVELYEKRLISSTTEMQSLSSQNGELRGAGAAKDAQIADMQKTIENRNPKLEGVLEKLMGFMESVDTRLKKLDGHLGTQDTVLKRVRKHQKAPLIIKTRIGKR